MALARRCVGRSSARLSPFVLTWALVVVLAGIGYRGKIPLYVPICWDLPLSTRVLTLLFGDRARNPAVKKLDW
jgi:hypothetical protein